MHRNSVDNAVTYTPNDLVLFRESPFALWMERLTLENPDHGIPPDVGSTAPREETLPQDEIVDTLREEGRDVVLVDWDLDDERRRGVTMDAMRQGADFIVNGALALGSLSANANLLMRTSGYSDLGDYLYIPCDTQAHSTGHAAFRLCFLAELLHYLQGQLPPQMLLIRGDADVVPLQTEDHIYYFRAVSERFTQSMDNFRKHRMPDPAQSAHFGRWSECASEVLRQRALSAEHREFEDSYGEPEIAAQQVMAEQTEQEREEEWPLDAVGQPLHENAPAEEVHSVETPSVAAAGGGMPINVAGVSDVGASVAMAHGSPGEQVIAPTASNVSTLAEQARQLAPDTLKPGAGPGRTPNLAQFPVRKRPSNETGDGRSESSVEPFDEPEVSLQVDDQPRSAASAEAQSEGADHTPFADEVSASDFFDDTLQNLAFIGSGVPVSMTEAEDEELEPRFVGIASEPDPPGEDIPEKNQGEATRVETTQVQTTKAETAQAETPGVSDFDKATTAEVTQALLSQMSRAPTPAPPPTLREVPPEDSRLQQKRSHERNFPPEPQIEGYEVEMIDLEAVKRESSEPHLLPPDRGLVERGEGDWRDVQGSARDRDLERSPFVDLDSAPPPTLMPVNLKGAEQESSRRQLGASGEEREDRSPERDRGSIEAPSPPGQFSDSLITNHDYRDDD